MSGLFSQDSMAEFFVQSLISHWFVAIVLVALVALFVTSRKSLNATTRHNIWLITLISFILMPLLVFAPKPSASVNLLDFFTAQRVEQLSSRPVAPVKQNQANIQSTGSLNTDNSNTITTPVNSTFIPKVTMSSAPEAHTSVENNAITNSLNFVALMKMLFVLWGVGSLYLIRRLWGEYKAARELELQSDSVTPYFERRFADLCQRLDIKEKPLLRFHAGINAPMTVGMIRVWVAIPMAWREEIDDDIFDQTLTHELGHIARKDPLVNTVQRLLNIVFWMYPAVWYVSRQLELERESACDDWVLTHDGKGHTYANNLLNVAESLYLQPHVLAVGCLRSHSQLSRRIQNLLNKSSDHAVKNSWKLLAATTVGLLMTLSASAVIWPSAPANTTNQASAQNAGSAEAEPDTQINFSDKGMQVLVNGVVVDTGTSTMPTSTPSAPINPNPQITTYGTYVHPEKPDVIVNTNTGNYVSSTSSSNGNKNNSSRHSIRSDNGGYGSGNLTIIRDNDDDTVRVELAPVIDKKDHPLLHAVWSGEWLDVKRLLKSGSDVNEFYKRPTTPRTALNAAILQSNLDMVEFLVENGADVKADYPVIDHEKKITNALTVAAMIGNKDIAKYLLKAGAPADDATMIIAIQNKDIGFVQFLLNNNIKPVDGALAVAVQNRDLKMAKFLLINNKCGCLDVNTGLMIAIQNRDEEMVNLLVNHGADGGEPALLAAIQTSDRKMVKWLIDEGAEVNDGALIIAIQSGDEKIIDLVQKQYTGAINPDSKDYDWERFDDLEVPEAIATLKLMKMLEKSGDFEKLEKVSEKFGEQLGEEISAGVVNFIGDMSKNGANVESIALVKALEMGDIDLAYDLINDGAIPNTLHITQALERNNTDLARKFLEKGAAPSALNILQALENQETELAEYFMKNGAKPNGIVLLKAMETEDKQLIKLVQSYIKENKTTEIGDNNFNKKTNNKSEEEHRASFSFTQWPVESNKISLAFNDSAKQFTGNDSLHEALDFPMPKGSQVKVVADGVVIEARYSDSFGNYILVDHGNAYFTKYANNKINKVSKGDHVNKGQVIALVGDDASMSSGPHLHFEVKYGHVKIDPETFLKPKT